MVSSTTRCDGGGGGGGGGGEEAKRRRKKKTPPRRRLQHHRQGGEGAWRLDPERGPPRPRWAGEGRGTFSGICVIPHGRAVRQRQLGDDGAAEGSFERLYAVLKDGDAELVFDRSSYYRTNHLTYARRLTRRHRQHISTTDGGGGVLLLFISVVLVDLLPVSLTRTCTVPFPFLPPG